MIIANKYEVPDSCPLDCPDRGMLWGQNSLCVRCPIFNCSGDDPLLRPEDFRDDWAEEWERWFKTDMKQLPVLYLFPPEWIETE